MPDPIRLVTWRDSNRYIGQVAADQEFDIEVIYTVGWLVKEDKFKIVLAQDNFQNIEVNDFRGVIVIPRENIMAVISLDSLSDPTTPPPLAQ
jgi:hypothetical protein